MKALLSLFAGLGLYAGVSVNHIVDVEGIDDKHQTEKQQIESRIIQGYGLDTSNLKFEILPEDSPFLFYGVYAPWCDSLKLDYYAILRVAKKYNLNSDSLLNRTMNHELGHYRVDKLQEKLCLKSEMSNKYSRDLLEVYLMMLNTSERDPGMARIMFENFVDIKKDDLTNILIDRIINEGIAVYFEDSTANPIQTSWPTSVNAIKKYEQYDRFLYFTSFALVQPILSVYGEKGIEFILKNMPTIDEFGDLQGYQKKVLEELAK